MGEERCEMSGHEKVNQVSKVRRSNRAKGGTERYAAPDFRN